MSTAQNPKETKSELERFLADCQFVMPNLNDTFSYATADTERISIGDGQILAKFWRDHGWHGLCAIAAVSRRRMPLDEIRDDPRFLAALDALHADTPAEPTDPEEPAWTLRDEFELR